MNKVTVLEKIIQDKYQWIEFNKKKLPFSMIISNLKKSNRNFYKKLLHNKKKSFILECKKFSPSYGMLNKNFDLLKISKIYKQYASIISVLTDEKYFHGNFNYLCQISNLVELPILCKDFIIDPWQIYLARLYKADAVLLMLSVLDNNKYQNLVKVAHNLNMGVLTEVINEEEMSRAINLQAKVIAINNRNLHDLSIDLNRTRKLSLLCYKKKVKLISASGIKYHSEIKNLSKYVDGFLIGSSLMLEKDLNITVRKILLGENKVCGLKSSEDACAVYKAGAVYGGLIFVPKSPRFIQTKQAISITKKNNKLKFVGVFYNNSINQIVKIVNILKLNVIQLHGQEDHIYIIKLRKLLSSNCMIWKAFDMSYQKPNYNLINSVDRLLLDNGGGTGKTFDWSLINTKFLNKTILSGGLSIYNCSNAIAIGCVGLDFNSGIEIYPGIKDHKKLFKIFQVLRTYNIERKKYE